MTMRPTEKKAPARYQKSPRKGIPNFDVTFPNKGGRPPKYATAEALEAKIIEYFLKGVPWKQVLVKTKTGTKWVEQPCPTLTGMVLYLGYADKQSFFDLAKHPKFAASMKRAKCYVERVYEEHLQSGNTVGAIFALKNFGWTDRVDVTSEHHDYLHVEFKDKTSKDLKEELKTLHNRTGKLLQLEDSIKSGNTPGSTAN